MVVVFLAQENFLAHEIFLAHDICVTEGAVQTLGRHIADRLADSFKEAGWDVERMVDAPGPQDQVRVWADLVVRSGDRIFVIEIKTSRDNRRAHLRGLFSEAALRAEIAARRLGGTPLPVVGSPRLTDAMVNDLKRYAQTYAPHLSLGVADAEGRLEFIGADTPAIRPIAVPTPPPDLAPKGPQTLFTDMNQWLLKVMLAERLPSGLVSAPRGPYARASDIAHAARVSAPTAWRFLSALESLGFAETTSRRITLVRVDELLERWRLSTDPNPAEVPVVFGLPPSDVLAETRSRVRRLCAQSTPAAASAETSSRKPSSATRIALGLFAACSALGQGFVSGAPVHLYVESLNGDFLRRLGMAPASRDEKPHVMLRLPRSPESVFRAAVVHDGVPTSDILQCWLDLSHHPARGREQADRLWTRLLRPSLGA